MTRLGKARNSDRVSHAELMRRMNYNPDTGIFSWKVDSVRGHFKVGDRADRPCSYGYRRLFIDTQPYLVHRLAWFYVHAEWPPNQVDHINGDRSDNRLSNLRLADHQQNQANSPRRSTKSSKFKGVYKYGNRWKAFIGLNRKTRYLGTFKTEAEAANAYMTVARSAFGDFAYRANEHSDNDSG